MLSSGSKNNLFYVLLRDYGSKVAADVMFRMCRISAFFLMNRGFSVSVMISKVIGHYKLYVAHHNDREMLKLLEFFLNCNSKHRVHVFATP